MGLFLPCDYARSKGKVEPYVERRLKHIVTACYGGTVIGSNGVDDDIPLSILDVGCGDGALIPYLFNTKEDDGGDEDATEKSTINYKGLDVSTVMIDMAKSQHSKYTFVDGSFPEDLDDNERFDTILFNGSLQFFRDTIQTLQHARARLFASDRNKDNDDDTPQRKNRRKSRIVLSHVQGAKFVKDECRTSQGVAVRNMPNKVSLEDYAKLMNMKVLYKEEILIDGIDKSNNKYDPQLDGDDDQFYLVVLEEL